MAKTSAERVKEHRERRKRKAIAKERELAPRTYQQPFFEWLAENSGREWDDGDVHKDASQITISDFTDDSGPHSVDGEVELIGEDDPEGGIYIGYTGSLGRAERLVDDLLSLAGIYARTINTYKKEEINTRITEIEQSDLSDPAAKKQALADIVRLQKMLDQLDKQVRWTFPQWKVTGE
jgi:hypothetical protein